MIVEGILSVSVAPHCDLGAVCARAVVHSVFSPAALEFAVSGCRTHPRAICSPRCAVVGTCYMAVSLCVFGYRVPWEVGFLRSFSSVFTSWVKM